MPAQPKKINILSLDGGGIRGIITCVILRYIEQELQRIHDPNAKLGDYFDLVAGSSTGALITAIILHPNDHKKAKYTIDKALELYAKKGNDIFNVNLWEKIINPFGLFNEKISEQALEQNLQEFFADLELNQLIKPCVITSYDTENRCVKIFNTLDGSTPVDNFYVKDVCRATTAAPTYFEPAHITSLYGQKFSLIDGGVYANNPALCAYAEARKVPFSKVLNKPEKPNFPTIKQMFIVSISTGTIVESYSYEDFKHAGKIEWVQPIIDMLLSSNAESVDYQLRQMYKSLGARNQKNYYRLSPDLHKASPEMDNVTPENIENLIQAALCYIDDHRETLDEIVKKLIKNQ